MESEIIFGNFDEVLLHVGSGHPGQGDEHGKRCGMKEAQRAESTVINYGRELLCVVPQPDV